MNLWPNFVNLESMGRAICQCLKSDEGKLFSRTTTRILILTFTPQQLPTTVLKFDGLDNLIKYKQFQYLEIDCFDLMDAMQELICKAISFQDIFSFISQIKENLIT